MSLNLHNVFCVPHPVSTGCRMDWNLFPNTVFFKRLRFLNKGVASPVGSQSSRLMKGAVFFVYPPAFLSLLLLLLLLLLLWPLFIICMCLHRTITHRANVLLSVRMHSLRDCLHISIKLVFGVCILSRVYQLNIRTPPYAIR
jgi:hypothetical protein